MQIEIMTVGVAEAATGAPCGLTSKADVLDVDAASGGCRRLEMAAEGGFVVELAGTCDGGMVIVRLSEAELRSMVKHVRADDITPTV